jgi:hypothetical protein
MRRRLSAPISGRAGRGIACDAASNAMPALPAWPLASRVSVCVANSERVPEGAA